MEISSAAPTPVLPSPSILDPSHPLAYLAYLPEDAAYELTISVYLLVAALVVQIWDVFNNLDTDYKVLKQSTRKFPLLVYGISRMSTILYLLFGRSHNAAAPTGDCNNLMKASSGVYCMMMASTSLLFYFRVSALYMDNKHVTRFFLFMWLALLGASLTAIIGVSGAPIGPTKHCVNVRLDRYLGIAVVIPFLNDTCVFIATTYRLIQFGLPGDAGIRDIFRVIISGNGLSLLTKALFKDGQAYYLTTAALTLVALILFYSDSLPIVYRADFPNIDVALINIMACRVFRRTKTGRYIQESILSDTKMFADFSRELRFRNEASSAADSSGTVIVTDRHTCPA
ncbi:hypothetical protein CVT26_014950 [Gymnopilus dilepis]|uniref:Uncharacterized protein n=1 Tax=Gymnopilus dilepis TaxID=231916 RepID=A0A409W3U0_9AGAR|nr:hypothetical protein CVT26_014950 [Gymnopilus dilepis]